MGKGVSKLQLNQLPSTKCVRATRLPLGRGHASHRICMLTQGKHKLCMLLTLAREVQGEFVPVRDKAVVVAVAEKGPPRLGGRRRERTGVW